MRQSLYKEHKIEDLGNFDGQRTAADSGRISDSKKAFLKTLYESKDIYFL